TGGNYFTILGGTVNLLGGENTLYQGYQGTNTQNQNLAVGPGGTLTFSKSQMVGDLRSPNGNAFVGSGGTINGSGAAGDNVLVSVNANSGWGGQITGTTFFNKAGANTLTVYNDNTYTGGTLVNGGAFTLTDAGRLSA